ncbi:unnamed protein product [Moneuplotes crassus]|uniref:inorganic diphosphatase n=1 Tax=Euplotes crassus TaxID=5936 RepID=A0AAD2D433_EUPCR|nr:unnamed protein product [Moneuplotes crassus]
MNLLKYTKDKAPSLCKQTRKFTSMSGGKYTTEVVGEGFGYKEYLLENGKRISPWHDLSLRKSGNIFTGYFELSFDDLKKKEVDATIEHNPVVWDTHSSRVTGEKQLRYYAKFPYVNYGMLPQTWENSTIKDPKTGAFGDNDPLDICELGSTPIPTGSIVDIKILGSLCLIDQDELDWKILALNVKQADKEGIRDHKDFEEAYPAKIGAVREWYRTIKVHDGKQENTFGYNEQVLSAEQSLEIIQENHESYNDLIKGKIQNDFKFWLR